MKPEDIPDDIWEAAEAAGEAMHGRHERGWVAWPLIPAHGTASHREIVARVILAERLKEREACAVVASSLADDIQASADELRGNMRDYRLHRAAGIRQLASVLSSAAAYDERLHAIGFRS